RAYLRRLLNAPNRRRAYRPGIMDRATLEFRAEEILPREYRRRGAVLRQSGFSAIELNFQYGREASLRKESRRTRAHCRGAEHSACGAPDGLADGPDRE